MGVSAAPEQACAGCATAIMGSRPTPDGYNVQTAGGGALRGCLGS